ncbi:CoA transferase [Herbaspirillum lusitanum]|uniref:CoA transferase n=1 Tax=Herbaspirillum lusitanum TaxID=213312 RepID=A0ABW9ADK4_9BURK
MKGPLSGTRIIECASQNCPLPLRLAISFTGRMAADLGADVHRIGAPADDPIRKVGPFFGEESALSAFLDLNKKKPIQQPLQHSIQQPISADGADPAALLRSFNTVLPDILLCDDAAFGALGDYAAQRVRTVFSMTPAGTDASGRADASSEFTLMASSGLLDLVGDTDREPLKMGGRQLAYSCGLSAYAASIAALAGVQGGISSGEVVRVSMADVAVWLNWKSVAMAAWSGSGKSRLGRDAEWQVIRCADGWIALVYLEADWPVLRDFVDDARLSDPRFDDRTERRKEARHITEIVEQRFLRLTRKELKDMALQKRLPLGPVWTPLELETDPQNISRHFFSRVKASDGTSLLMPRLPILWNGSAMPCATEEETR